MALRYADSCAAYASVADVNTAGWSFVTASPVVETNTSRWGLGELRCAGGAGATNLSRTFGTGLSAWVVGWVARFGTGFATGQPWFLLREGATVHLDLRWDASQHLIVTRNGTLLGTSTNTFTDSVHYTIQIKATIHDTTGAVEIRVNNVVEISLTNVDTRNAGTGLVDIINWRSGTSGGNQHWVSEVYICDTTGSAPNNDIWGDYRIEARRTSAAGNYAQWAPSASTNESNVDDTPGNDGDTTYNSSATAGQKDTFQFGAITPTGGTVLGIMHRIVARKDDAGTREIRPIQRQGGTDYSGTTRGVTTAHAHYTEPVEINPATGVAYTVAEMRATSPEFGYELVS